MTNEKCYFCGRDEDQIKNMLQHNNLNKRVWMVKEGVNQARNKPVTKAGKYLKFDICFFCFHIITGIVKDQKMIL